MSAKKNIVPAVFFLIALIFSQFSTPQPVSAECLGVVFVSPSGNGTTGCSWGNAFVNLQDALTAADSGDQIWVAAGTYYPDEGAGQTNNDRNSTFTLKNNVSVYGGFAGGETLLTQRNPDLNLTILSGDIGVLGTSTDNAYSVVTALNITLATILDGFTIQNGYEDSGSDFGGGVYVSNSTAALQISNVTITNNFAGNGGGLAAFESNLNLSKVIFTNNTSRQYGGGFFNQDGSPTLVDVVFDNNQTQQPASPGGGMHSTNSNPVIYNVQPSLTNVTFSNNRALQGGGGGLFNFESHAILTNVTFSGNSASVRGGAMLNEGSNPVLNNVTLSGNTAPAGSGGAIRNIYALGVTPSSPVIRNTILWGNGSEEIVTDAGSTVTISNSVIQGGCPALGTCTGLITTNPNLGLLTNNGGFTETRAIGVGSSALNTGNNATCAADDQRDVARPRTGADPCDIGAFEYTGNQPPTVTASIADINVLEDAADTVFSLYPNFQDAETADNLLTYAVQTNTNASLFTTVNITDATNFTLDYAPNANGIADITIRVTDAGGLYVDDTFRVTVTAVNDQPDFTAANPSAVNEDAGAQTLAGWVTALDLGPNDEDASQNVLGYVLSNSTCGTLLSAGPAVSAAGTLTYTPSANQNGTCTFDLQVQDNGGTANGGSDTGPIHTITITINAVNDPSDAINDTATVLEDAAATAIDVRANDTDIEDTFTTELITAVTQPANGTVVITGGGTGLTYQPSVNYCDDGTPTDNFTYTLSGGDIATVAVTVTCVNDPSDAINDTATVLEDATATAINVRGNDIDVDSAVELITAVTQPANGTVIITNAGANLTYQPNANYCNDGTPTDNFTYTLAGGDIATVAITVTCVADVSDALDDTTTVLEDAAATAINVRGNDTDADSAVELITAVTQPANGTVVITGGGTGLTYQPNASYCNDGTPTDNFTYTLSGGDTATVAVTVICADVPSDAVNDTATLLEDATATAINVRGNDTDVDSAVELITAVTQPTNGTVVITGGGIGLTYQPTANYCNGGTPTDNFTYTLSGGDTATVAITVTCVADVSNAVNDTTTVLEDAAATTINVRGNDTDVDSVVELITAVTQPANGTVVITNAGTDLTYQPNLNYCNDGTPTDNFTYTLAGGNTATVAVTVTCANDPSDAINDTATVLEDAAATAIDVRANDTDIEDTFTTELITSVTQPANGTVIITNAGADLTYQPNASYCNDGTPTDNFTYTLVGGDTATLAVTVTCANDPSDAINDTATVLEDAAATTINVRGNDTDVDSAVELITAVTQPANGTVIITNAGTDLTYQPNLNYCNGGTPTDNFTYTLTGGDTATVAVTVTCVVDVSNAVNDTTTVTEDALPTTINVRGNDTDVDSAVELITAVTQPANGTVVITNAGADLTYQPNASYCNDGTPTDNFTYTLAGGDIATVAVTVTCVGDPSDTVNDTSTVLEDVAATTINVRANDTDIDSAVELITAVTQPANGTVVNNSTNLTYQPNANYCNDGTPTDNFTYTLAGGDTATVAVTVTCINDTPSFTAASPAPVALNSGAQSVGGWATFNPGPNETGQNVLQYNISNAASCGALLSAGPSVSTAGTLTYTVALNQSGTCTFDVSVQDDGGTTNGGVNTSPTQNFTITVNNGISVTINQAVGQTDPTGNTPINFTVVFGSSVANFDSTDVTLSGSAVGVPTTAVVTGAGTTYNIEVSGMIGNGLVTVTIPAGVASDLGGNPNTASTGDGTVTYDTAGPLVLFNANTVPADGSTVQGGPTKITIAFNKNLRDDASNPGGAEFLANYLLVGYGPDLTLDANTNCTNRAQGDDVNYPIDSASFIGNTGTGTYITTLGINGGTPLPLGTYYLFICGTTSITDLAGNELNNGTADTIIDFRVVQATAIVPKTGFAMNTVTNLPIQPEGLAYTSTDMWMEIPSLGVKTSIVGVTKTSSGWDVTWLDRNAGWLEGSAYPTWNGNSVVTAHVWDALNKPGPFARLKELKYGDQVKIHAFGQVYTYEVRETISISPTNATSMLKHQEKSWLTLVTCEGFQELTKDYSSRRMVRAVLVSVTAEK